MLLPLRSTRLLLAFLKNTVHESGAEHSLVLGSSVTIRASAINILKVNDRCKSANIVTRNVI
jgi:hypothetical protein